MAFIDKEKVSLDLVVSFSQGFKGHSLTNTPLASGYKGFLGRFNFLEVLGNANEWRCSNYSMIAGVMVPAAAACPTICIIFWQLFHSNYCAAAAARNLLASNSSVFSYLRPPRSWASKEIFCSQKANGRALYVGRLNQTKLGEYLWL